MCAESIDGLDTHTVESDALLERLGVVLSSGVEHAHCLDEFALRYAASIVAHADTEVVLDVDFDALAGVHLEFVDGVIDNFLEEDIDAVLWEVAVAEASDVHTRTSAHMLHVGEVANVVVGVLDGGLDGFF